MHGVNTNTQPDDDVVPISPNALCALKVERRVPVVNQAALAVKVATTRIGQLKGLLQERDATIAQLRQDVVSAMADAEKSRERADKLEARFTQVITWNPFRPYALLSTWFRWGRGLRLHRAALDRHKTQQDTEAL